MSEQSTVAIPRIEATASAPVSPPPSRTSPPIVDAVVVSAVDDYEPPPRRARRWRMPVLFGGLAIVSLIVGATAGLVLSPLLFASATITLTPEEHMLSTTNTITLPVRMFPADHERLSRTVATTGTATRPATAARGSITFYNALPAPQPVPAGTLLVSASGIPVSTEEDAYIPAASPPTEGMTTVRAHAENTGSAGNIAAGTISGPCCRAYVLAYGGVFSGGADARTYRTPTPSDIADAVAPLRSQAARQMQGAIHAWLLPHEVLLPPTCDVTTSSSAQPGDEADHVAATVWETCTAAAYIEDALESAATAGLGAVATREFGPAYRLVSVVHTGITGTTLVREHAVFRVQIDGLYSYRFSPQELTRLRLLLAGGSRDRGVAILDHSVGVRYARIESSGATLPRDPSRIRIILAPQRGGGDEP